MKNYEAEKLRKIIKAKEKAMVIQVAETDELRKELNRLKYKMLYSYRDMQAAFNAGKLNYEFKPWITQFLKQTNQK